MRSYKETTDRIFEKSTVVIRERKKKRKRAAGLASAAVCLVLMLSVGAWQSGILNMGAKGDLAVGNDQAIQAPAAVTAEDARKDEAADAAETSGAEDLQEEAKSADADSDEVGTAAAGGASGSDAAGTGQEASGTEKPQDGKKAAENGSISAQTSQQGSSGGAKEKSGGVSSGTNLQQTAGEAFEPAERSLTAEVVSVGGTTFTARVLTVQEGLAEEDALAPASLAGQVVTFRLTSKWFRGADGKTGLSTADRHASLKALGLQPGSRVRIVYCARNEANGSIDVMHAEKL